MCLTRPHRPFRPAPPLGSRPTGIGLRAPAFAALLTGALVLAAGLVFPARAGPRAAPVRGQAGAGVAVLLADADALAEGGRLGLVEDPGAAAWADGDLGAAATVTDSATNRGQR